jgi:hypothetical protein
LFEVILAMTSTWLPGWIKSPTPLVSLTSKVYARKPLFKLNAKELPLDPHLFESICSPFEIGTRVKRFETSLMFCTALGLT